MLSSVPTDTKLTVFWANRYTPYRHIHWTLFSTHLKRKTLHLINQWSHERIIMITEEELFCIGIKCEIFPLAELYHYSWAWWIMNMKICATNENNNLFGKKLDIELSVLLSLLRFPFAFDNGSKNLHWILAKR